MDAVSLTLDDRFHLLLHKKIMNKTGSAKRRSKNITKINIKNRYTSQAPPARRKRHYGRPKIAVVAPVLLTSRPKSVLWKWS